MKKLIKIFWFIVSSAIMIVLLILEAPKMVLDGCVEFLLKIEINIIKKMKMPK